MWHLYLQLESLKSDEENQKEMKKEKLKESEAEEKKSDEKIEDGVKLEGPAADPVEIELTKDTDDVAMFSDTSDEYFGGKKMSQKISLCAEKLLKVDEIVLPMKRVNRIIEDADVKTEKITNVKKKSEKPVKVGRIQRGRIISSEDSSADEENSNDFKPKKFDNKSKKRARKSLSNGAKDAPESSGKSIRSSRDSDEVDDVKPKNATRTKVNNRNKGVSKKIRDETSSKEVDSEDEVVKLRKKTLGDDDVEVEKNKKKVSGRKGRILDDEMLSDVEKSVEENAESSGLNNSEKLLNNSELRNDTVEKISTPLDVEKINVSEVSEKKKTASHIDDKKSLSSSSKKLPLDERNGSAREKSAKVAEFTKMKKNDVDRRKDDKKSHRDNVSDSNRVQNSDRKSEKPSVNKSKSVDESKKHLDRTRSSSYQKSFSVDAKV